jgi:hypothetical protein
MSFSGALLPGTRGRIDWLRLRLAHVGTDRRFAEERSAYASRPRGKKFHRSAAKPGNRYPTEAIVDYDQNRASASPSRLLVAADESIDPHRLVRLCCERAETDLLSVSLLVPTDDKPVAWFESAAPERLLRRVAALLDAAGVRLEDVIAADEHGHEVDQLVRFGGFDALLVCASREKAPSSALSLAVRLARLHGLTVLDSGHQAAPHASWLRRLLDPLVHWPHPG